jgi:branched-chain amino acid transport system substrate-binding protein
MVNTVLAWVKYTNEQGGLNGHRVRMIVYDDGMDPARHRAQVQEAVERKGVIAFVQQQAGITGRGSVEYITSNRVPVIGNEGGSEWFYESPMYFPPMATATPAFASSVYNAAMHMVPTGHTKVGVVVCAEAQACSDLATAWLQLAPPEGMEVVYHAKASLATPDFTAECSWLWTPAVSCVSPPRVPDRAIARVTPRTAELWRNP